MASFLVTERYKEDSPSEGASLSRISTGRSRRKAKQVRNLQQGIQSSSHKIKSLTSVSK
jgi:hypothetical protein